jgi:hypothetical protein
MADDTTDPEDACLDWLIVQALALGSHRGALAAAARDLLRAARGGSPEDVAHQLAAFADVCGDIPAVLLAMEMELRRRGL